MVEHPEWGKFFKIVNPAFKPPTRYETSGPILNNVYAEMDTARQEQLAEAKNVYLLCDGWSNIR